ncbi:MAG: radical SAM protein [Blastocatellia bacterium]
MLVQITPTRLRQPVIEPFFSAAPQVVGVEITGRCQLRCRHCFNHSGPDNRRELPVDVIERLLDEMLTWGVRDLRLSGGEPTFHRQFREVVKACQERGIRIAMNSHGVYSAELLDYLQTAPIDLFFISIDGLEANNDAIRGAGAFRRASHSCRKLRAAGQRVIIAMHVGAGNYQDVSGLIELAAEIGVGVKFSPLRPVGRAIEELPRSLIQPADYLAVVREVSRLRAVYPDIQILTDFDILDGAPSGDCHRDPNSASCKAGRTMVNINYDGGIYPCAFFVTPEGEFSAGNIYRETVTEVWRRSPVFEPFRIHQKSEVCQSCSHYRRQCVGGCPAIAHFTTGHLDAHDPTCFADLVRPPDQRPER